MIYFKIIFLLLCTYVIFSWVLAAKKLKTTKTGVKFVEHSYELFSSKFGHLLPEDVLKGIVLKVLVFFSFIYIHSFIIYDWKRFKIVQKCKAALRDQKAAIQLAEATNMEQEKIDSLKRGLRQLKVYLEDLKNFEEIE